MTGVFGDALAMALVAVGSVLIALLLWLLMRKYNRQYPKEGEPSRIATPATMSRETTVTLLGPCKQPNEFPSVSGVEITKRASEELDPRPKETPAVSPGEKPASAEKSMEKPMGQDKKKHKPADKPADKQVADKEGVEAKGQGLSGKKREGSPAGAGSSEQNKEQQPKGEHRKKKSKKSDQRSPTSVDSDFSKRKSKQPKRSKPSGTQPDAANATTDAAVVSPTSPSEGATQEPTSDTTSPPLPQQPSQAEAQASHQGAKGPTVAIVDPGAASHTHDLDDSTLQKLRKEVMTRRASHVSAHSARSRTAAESAKVPTELDIFSEEHSAASIARAAAAREKQSHSGHKRKHKRKSSPSRQAPNVPADGVFSGSTSECTSSPPGPESPPGTGAGVAPASQARDLDESTLVQLRRDICVRRASCVPQHTLRPAPRVAKVPTELDIFSGVCSPIGPSDDPKPKTKNEAIFSEQPSPK
ncbi:uncharacterized protein DDB_G0286299-like isoform X2 [Dermacentor albipictus]|uniref:uncharacterized protein DDB_G0286299-like isoform X2 n=1 Tax=Dermacentor albipictus TaxID=60249 RepID=UPI0038FC9034